jgi:DNA-binding transcriptional LysR family regulator
MSRRYYKLPPLTSLATFETAARHRSFKGAAEELGVTPGAVSHQIKFLETELGLSLFDRKHHGNNLTNHGESLFAALQSSFAAVSSTLANLRRSATDTEVTISATTAVSGLWLTPRLSQFWREHPEIPVNQHVTDNPDSQGIAIDLKICYGFVENESTQKHTLFHDELVPVCSSNFASKNPNPTIEELAQMPLIHLRAKDKNWSNWFSWFTALGHKGKISQGTHVNNYMIALQAASDGTGIVLGWKHLCKPKIDTGELVILGDTSIPAPSAIYIMSEKEELLSENIKALRDFLIKKP